MTEGVLTFGARRIGDDGEATVTGDHEGAWELAWFNPGCEVVVAAGPGERWEPFYGPWAVTR